MPFFYRIPKKGGTGIITAYSGRSAGIMPT